MARSTQATADAAAELERLEQEQHVDLPDPSVDDVPLFGAGVGSYDSGDDEGSTERSGSPRTEIRVLEDLYAAYPKLGDGDWKIHIERTAPLSFRGRRTAGFLGECYDRLSTAEFAQRFGGASYCVKVLKPTSSGSNATRSDYQTVKQFKFRVPGDPTMEGIPQQSTEDDVAMKFDPRYLTGGVPEAVQIEQLRLTEKERERQHAEHIRMQNKIDEERRRASQVPPEQIAILHESTKHLMEDSRAQVQTQTAFFMQEVDRLRAENAAVVADNQQLRERASKAERDASDHNRILESQAVRDITQRSEKDLRDQKELYESRSRSDAERSETERRRLLEESRDQLSRLETDHRKQLDEMNRRHDEERRQSDARAIEERERIREESRTRIEQIERDKKERIEQLLESNRQRIEDLTRTTAREIDSLRDQTRREIDSTRQAERSQAMLSSKTAESRVTIMESELSRMRDQEREQRSRLREAEKELHKPALQALSEAKAMAMEFGGVVDASTVTGDRSVLEQIAPMVKPALESIGQIMDRIGQTRAQNQQARQAAVVQQAPAQRQLPAPGARYQSAPIGAPPALAWAPRQQSSYQSPPMGGAMTMGGPAVPFSPPMTNMPSPVQPGANGMPFGASPTDSDGGSSQESFGPNATMSQPAPFAQPTAAAATNINPAIREFCVQLEAVVAGRLMPPQAFAEQVVARIGPEQAAMLLQQFRPGDVLNIAAGLGGSGALQTRDGQRYVAALWQATAQLIGAHRQPPAAAAAPAPQNGGAAQAAPQAAPQPEPMAASTETDGQAQPGAVPIS